MVENKPKIVGIKMDAETVRKLKVLAAQQSTTMSDIVRKLVEDYLDSELKKTITHNTETMSKILSDVVNVVKEENSKSGDENNVQ